jgi:hypothetical protein
VKNDERNKQWKLAARAINRSGCSSQIVWDCIRKWFDGVAGGEQVVSAQTIVYRYMNTAKEVATDFIQEESEQ